MAVLERLHALLERRFAAAVGLLLLAYALLALAVVALRWQQVSAYEPEWVANALLAGHGYSFEGARRWLFEDRPAGLYFPTAWADPLFTFWLAGLMATFGDLGRLVGLLASLAFVLATAWLVALSARRLGGPLAGLLAVIVLLGTVREQAVALNASLLAGLWVALLLHRFVADIRELRPSHGLVLGLVLGLAALTSSSTLILLPVMVLALVRFAPSAALGARAAAVMAVSAVLLVSPWTLRNHLVFDELVPVRNGLGQISHIGTVGLANTYAPDALAMPVPAPWRASGPAEAVERTLGASGFHDDRRALERWQMALMRERAISGYEEMNEAQRDRLYLRDALRFVAAQPGRTLELALPKLSALVALPGGVAALTTVLGLAAGVVAALLWQRLLAVPLALIFAYALPFTIIVPYFWRYRYPIEPALAVVTAVGLVCLAGALWGRLAAGVRAAARSAGDLGGRE